MGSKSCFAVISAQTFSELGSVQMSSTPNDDRKCGRCDGPHISADCPHYRKARPEHKDARRHYGNVPAPMMSDDSNWILRGALSLRQPGDGHCLFHSLGAGLEAFGSGEPGLMLRREICEFLLAHGNEMYGETNTWHEWVRYESGTALAQYCDAMF